MLLNHLLVTISHWRGGSGLELTQDLHINKERLGTVVRTQEKGLQKI